MRGRKVPHRGRTRTLSPKTRRDEEPDGTGGAGGSLAELHLSMLLRELPAVVWATDPELLFTFVAGSGLQGLDLDPEELIGSSILAVYAMPYDDAWLSAHRRALQGEEVSLLGPFRNTFWQARLELLRDAAGVGCGVIGVAVEGTELVAARHDAQERLAALQWLGEERRRLLADLTEGEKAERRRLSREIHDHVGQLLTSASLYAAALRTDDHHNATKVRSLIDEAQLSLRDLVRSMRVPATGRGDLVDAIQQLVEDLDGHGVLIDVHGTGGTASLATEVTDAAFRVAQESVTNAIRHARASTVSIVVARVGDWLTLVVEDDGVGFDPDEGSGEGSGLAGMRERAAALGGALRTESSPGRGTAVHLDLPVGGPST